MRKYRLISLKKGFPYGSDVKRICLRYSRPGFNCWVRKLPWRREWLSSLIFLPGLFHGQRSLAGYSPWGHKESNTTEPITLKLFTLKSR